MCEKFVTYFFVVFQNYVDYCGEHGVNYPIEGQHPVQAASVHPVGGHRVTGLAVKPVGQFIVALLGTDQGQLVKVSEDVIYTIICLKSVAVRKLQVGILARSPREMSQTDRIV